MTAALAFCACSSSENNGDEGEIDPPSPHAVPIKISTTMEGVDGTRATDYGFEAGDRIGLFVVNHNADGTPGIGWSPNRLVRLRYVGESRYEVVLSQNSKLVPGDSFVTGCFIKEQPLYLPYIERPDGRTAPFVAGRNGGLTIINVINIEK